MSESGWQADNCLSMLGELETSWQAAVDMAMSVRDEQLSMAHQAIFRLRQQLQQEESIVRFKNKEVESLKLILSDLNMKLDVVQADMANLLEDTHRQLQEQTLKHKEELEEKSSEVEELRARHKESIRDLTAGVRSTLHDLECQLESVKMSEELYRKKVDELEKANSKKEKHLHDWNRVSEQMCAELSEVKNKLQSSKYSNTKLREEIALWKKYCEKVEEERKTEKRGLELERKVMSTLNKVDSFLKTDIQHRNVTLEAMNNFGRNVMKEITQLNTFKRLPAQLTSVESQTEAIKGEEVPPQNNKKDLTIVLKQREIQLEEELKRSEFDVENLKQQNLTLRDVIKAMKREREILEKEKEQIEEEVKVSKLEESVRLLKNNFMHEQKDVCVWNALQDVKKEVSNLKNKNLHKTVKSNTNS